MTEVRTLSTERIYEGKIVSLRVDEIEISDGQRAKREVIEHRGAVAVVAIHEGDVLLVEQFRYATGETLLGIPAGTLESGEHPDECALRELEEETGYRASTLRRLFELYLAPGCSNEKIHVYLATDLTPTQTHLDADEQIELHRFPLNDIRELALSGRIRDAKTVAGLLASIAMNP